MSEYLHLVDGDGTICDAVTMTNYMATAMGAAPDTLLPALRSPLKSPTSPGARRRSSSVTAHAPHAEKCPSHQTLVDAECKYRVVGVFGGQSSGKSTLLNLLFGTKFQTMVEEDSGRAQTTLGCFMGRAVNAKNAGQNLFVLDFEGTDGMERGEDQNFEKQLSLFALSVADTLIVNMWSTEVGRFNAANLALLRTVFEVNLQLFASEPSKGGDDNKPTLLFALRDFTNQSQAGAEARIFANVNASLEKIWGMVTKPEAFADAAVTDMFNVRFCAFPHYALQRPEFDAKIDEFRTWFFDRDAAGADFVFGASDDTFRGVPLDGLSQYLGSCWSAIKETKELDIPSQREMLARLRCDEIIERLAAQFAADVKKRTERVKEGHLVVNVSAHVARLARDRAAGFEKDTKLYSRDVVAAKLELLAEQLAAIGKELVDAQCKKICEGLVRTSDASIQRVMDTAVHNVLPKLAAEWYKKMEYARTKAEKKLETRESSYVAEDDAAAAGQPDLGETSKKLLVEGAQNQVKLASTVRKFWNFLSSEVDSVTLEVRERLANSAGAADAGAGADGAGDGGAPAGKKEADATGRLLSFLAGDADGAVATVRLLEVAFRARISSRFEAMTSDVNSAMTRIFEKVLNNNDDGTMRFFVTIAGLNAAFGPARATGLLFLACAFTNRLSTAERQKVLDPASGAFEPEDDSPAGRRHARTQDMVDECLTDTFFLEFAANEHAKSLVGAPVYPARPLLPLPPAADGDLAADGAPAGDDADDQIEYDAAVAADSALEALILLDEARTTRAYELYQQHCDFTLKMTTRQIEASQTNVPAWVWFLLLFLGANEIWWLFTNPMALLFVLALVWLFLRQWVEAQWQRFQDKGPVAVVVPMQTALALATAKYQAHVAPLLNGAPTPAAADGDKKQPAPESKKDQ
jgi:hypothetical protein